MLTIINDLHLGVLRSAGTTPASAIELRGWMLLQFEKILDDTDNDLLILGDLLDTYQIPMTDLLQVYKLLAAWLDKGHRLHLVPGNHDLSTDSSKMSSFQFLGRLLETNSLVAYYGRGRSVIGQEGVYVIPHMPNQDLFELELAKVPECDFLLVHCNYDNNFAKESDHSLNFSREQVAACKAKKILFAHEHAHRRVNDKVHILGNTIPSSISDCLDGKNKYKHTIHEGMLTTHMTWDRSPEDDGGYVEMEWTKAQECEAHFIRFVGTCTSEESAAAADVIAKYRRTSQAFVVGNAVKVQTSDGATQLQVDSLEAVRSFDIMAALKEYLEPQEWAIVQGLK